MWFRTISFILLSFLVTAFPVHAQVPQSTAEMQMSFAPLVKKTSPAVVNIYVKRVVQQHMRMISPFFNDPFFNQFFGQRFGFNGMVRERVENSLGSGVIIDANGLMATNTHVVKDATEIIAATSDGREFSATKMLVDEKTDLAILKIDTKGEKLPFLPLADSDQIEVGDIVLAIGNPFGVGQTVTSGIVSALARTGVSTVDYGYFIQTDAAINPGNSGGALVDVQGRLIGVNSMIFSKDGGSLGIGFAIPANMVKTVAAAALSGGKLVRPWTGFKGQAVTRDMVESLGLDRAYGVLVNTVHPKSPAADAGLRVGDVVQAIDGKEVHDTEALQFRLATVAMGATIKLTVFRNGKNLDVDMITMPPPEEPKRDQTLVKGRNILSGAIVANISPAVSEELGTIDADSGVVVLGNEGGSAAQIGLRKGDVIVAINGIEIKSVRQLLKLLDDNRALRTQLSISRGGKMINLVIAQ